MRKILKGCAAIILGLVGVAATAPTVSAQGPACLVKSHHPHISTHSGFTRINGIGEVGCDYRPSGPLALEVRIVNVWNGSTVATDLKILSNSYQFVRHSRSFPCVSGNYRVMTRAYAGGPRGESRRWSLWAAGEARTITCGSGGGFGAR